VRKEGAKGHKELEEVASCKKKLQVARRSFKLQVASYKCQCLNKVDRLVTLRTQMISQPGKTGESDFRSKMIVSQNVI